MDCARSLLPCARCMLRAATFPLALDLSRDLAASPATKAPGAAPPCALELGAAVKPARSSRCGGSTCMQRKAFRIRVHAIANGPYSVPQHVRSFLPLVSLFSVLHHEHDSALFLLLIVRRVSHVVAVRPVLFSQQQSEEPTQGEGSICTAAASAAISFTYFVDTLSVSSLPASCCFLQFFTCTRHCAQHESTRIRLRLNRCSRRCQKRNGQTQGSETQRRRGQKRNGRMSNVSNVQCSHHAFTRSSNMRGKPRVG